MADFSKTMRRPAPMVPPMEILFIAGIAVITPDPPRSRELYMDALGLPLGASEGDDYFHSEQIGGSKHFGVWPLAQAAQACFGTSSWPADRAVPQASIEFEVADADAVQAAATELEERGFALLHAAREEPWGQTVARLQSLEGAIIGISFAPSLHDAARGQGHRPTDAVQPRADEPSRCRRRNSSSSAITASWAGPS
jgi:catechol 2,3-dioxygenase-like lactoylglutathione lyase family enzyme